MIEKNEVTSNENEIGGQLLCKCYWEPWNRSLYERKKREFRQNFCNIIEAILSKYKDDLF